MIDALVIILVLVVLGPSSQFSFSGKPKKKQKQILTRVSNGLCNEKKKRASIQKLHAERKKPYILISHNTGRGVYSVHGCQ